MNFLKENWFKLVIFLVILLIATVAGYIYVKKTISWKIYNSKEYGFELQYPANYEFHLGQGSNEPMFYIKNPARDIVYDSYYSHYAFELKITPGFLHPGVMSNPDEWASNQERLGTKLNEQIIDGKKVYVSDFKSTGNEIKMYSMFINKGNGFDMYQFYVKNNDVGEQILSTFKSVN